MPLARLFRPPDAATAAEVQPHEQWYNALEPRDLPAAPLYLQFAERRYDHIHADFDTMDLKAREILAASGITATVLAAAVIAQAIPLSCPAALAALSIIAAVILAYWARLPMTVAAPPAVRDLIDYDRNRVDVEGNPLALQPAEATILIAASLHLTVERIRVAINWKGQRVKWATEAFLVALAFLALAIVARVFA